jgi:hypothetical protein
MTVIASHLAGDNLLLLPAREAPYLLQDVYEFVKDGCRSEIVLQWSEGYLLFRADEDTDSLEFDFHHGKFEPSGDHDPLGSYEGLSDSERDVLNELAKGPKTKQQLGARAKLLGAFTREDFGKQGGGLLRRSLVTGKRLGRNIQYEITTSGRKALAAAPWKRLISKECGWTWMAINQQGYCDSAMLSFDGIVPTVLLHVIASSIELFTITRG